MIKVSLIIPYYQKREGILRRALTSVLDQEISEGIQVEVIVVDDGSPVPAETEVAGLQFAEPHRLVVLTQPNGGVGKARNTGLQHASEDVHYIAFLDSDDIWKPQHLAQAIRTLEQGYDYYFCDCRRIESEASFFGERDFAQFIHSIGAHAIGENVYDIDKDAFYRFSLRKRASMIPAIVFRHSVAPDLRFDTSLHVAGEDCLFLFQLIARCKNISCSLDELVICADGVNIYASKDSWNNPGHIIRQMGGLLALYKFREKLLLSRRDNIFFRERIKKVRQIVAFLTVRNFLKFGQTWSSELSHMIKRDSRFWLWYPLYVLYVCIGYPLKLYDPLDDFWCNKGSTL